MKNHRVYSLGLTQAKGPEPGDGHNLEEKGDTAWKRHPPLKGTMQMRDVPLRRASPCVIYLPLFEDAGDRLTTEFSLRPRRGCEPTGNRGSDRKTRKCQNSISKQTVNIVTLFMLNKKRSVLISNSEG